MQITEASSPTAKCWCSFPSFSAAALLLQRDVLVPGKLLPVVQASEVSIGTVSGLNNVDSCFINAVCETV